MTTSYTAKFNKSGNIKVGNMWTFNKLAGAGYLNGCKGTCGKHCSGCYNTEDPKKSSCYVFKSYVTYGWEKSTVVASHIRNTNAIRGDIDKAFEDIRNQIKRARNKPGMIRIHSSGELETAEELRNWMETAKMFPGIKFYAYTKAFEVVEEVFGDIDSSSIPDNFFINISIWHNEGIDIYNRFKHLNCIRAYVYDDGFDYASKGIDIDCHCPAYKKVSKTNKRGVTTTKVKLVHDLTCDKCKICFQAKAKVCACFDH